MEKQFVLQKNDKGEFEVHSEDEYVNIFEKDLNLIKGFIKENQKAFDIYMKKHRIGS